MEKGEGNACAVYSVQLPSPFSLLHSPFSYHHLSCNYTTELSANGLSIGLRKLPTKNTSYTPTVICVSHGNNLTVA